MSQRRHYRRRRGKMDIDKPNTNTKRLPHHMVAAIRLLEHYFNPRLSADLAQTEHVVLRNRSREFRLSPPSNNSSLLST